ncbi:MAG TPA: glycosyl hydrolase family 28-related protein [Armatimonadota bacterium]|nr:glycosyl hydrolase family 28-related protein [Armatimonadota bacterium]
MSPSMLLPIALVAGMSQQAAELPGVVTVRSCGAVGDGVSDDTAAFQAAIDKAAEVGGTVHVDPVEPGKGYVLTRTVVLERGTSLVGSLAGMPFIAWEGVPREIQTGPVILARPHLDEYSGEAKRPLFHLRGGNTIRGLYILYDEQPWPSDEEFEEYGYDSDAELMDRFIDEHVAPCGPTIYVQPGVASTTIEDITCGRYYDFFYTPAGGKIVINRCYLFGYKRAFAMKEARDVVRISEIHIVPNVEKPISWQHAKLQGAITSHPDNIAFDFGSVDGYSVSDVAVFLTHTGFKLGASEDRPFIDPMTGEGASFPWGAGPWGSMHNVKLDNCVVGFDCVVGTILVNQLSNIMIHASMAGDRAMQTTDGEVSRQAAFIVGPQFAGATLQINNLALSSFAPLRVAANAKMVHQGNGRAFLVDCPGIPEMKDYADRMTATLEIFGFVVSNIPETHLVGLTEGSQSPLRIHGFTHNGARRDDGVLE